MLVLSNLDFNSATRITNLPNGVANQEPATVAQLNAAIEGLAWKGSCRVASTGNLTISGPGSTIDGVTLAANNRVLVKDQTAPEENGIYVWNGAAVPMTRSADANTAAELKSATVGVDEGTANADTTWRQTEVPVTIGTDPIVWVTFGANVPQATESVAGKAELATQAETNTGTDDQRIVTPLKLANWSGRGLEYTSTIGDGANTQYDVVHNLGSRDLQVLVREAAGAYRQVMVDVAFFDTNTVRINFGSAPSLNSYSIYISKR